MSDLTLEKLNQFFTRYRHSVVDPRREEAAIFQKEYARVRGEFTRIKEEAERKAPFEAPQFNIFYLMGIDRDEVHTHSTFLAELLNPLGSHGQRTLFLDAFLSICQSKYANFRISNHEDYATKWVAFTEMVTPQGRPDIVLLNRHSKMLCLIENKIGAGEQPRQLERYRCWMHSRKDEFPFQALIFLTIHGVESSTAVDHDYYRLSYQRDIYPWLSSVYSSIQAPSVRELVRQYMTVVDRLK